MLHCVMKGAKCEQTMGVDMRSIVDGYVPYKLLWNARWGCGNPLVAFERRYGLSMYKYWKEIYGIYEVPFEYSEKQFGYWRIKKGKGKEIILYTFPKPDKDGQSIAVAVLFDDIHKRYAKVSFCLFNGKYRIVGKNDESRITYIFGELDFSFMNKNVAGLFNIILDLTGSRMELHVSDWPAAG